MSKFNESVLMAVHASSDYSRVMRDILSRRAETWGIMSAEVGMLDFPRLREKAKADPRWGTLLSAVEARLSSEGVDASAEQEAKPTKAENNIRTRMLKERISETGYTESAGVFRGIPENSFFLPGISRAELRSLAAEFDQYSYAFGVASLPPTDRAHYWFVRTSDDAVEQDGDPNEDLVHLPGPSSIGERKKRKREMMEGGEVGRLVEPGPDRSELGLRPFRMDKPPGEALSTLPLPDEAHVSQDRVAGHYYVLTRDASKYVGCDHVHREGVDDTFFPGGKPDVSVMTAILPLTEAEVELAVSQGSRIRRGQ